MVEDDGAQIEGGPTYCGPTPNPGPPLAPRVRGESRTRPEGAGAGPVGRVSPGVRTATRPIRPPCTPSLGGRA